MEKKEYKFNPQTLTYEVVTAPFKLRYYRLLRKILVAFILASIFNAIFSYFFYSPKLYRIHRENNELVIKYRILQSKIDASMNQLDEIKHRDNRVYRTLFAADTLSIDGVWAGMDSGKMTLKDETAGIEIPLACSFTERQKAILKAGGLLAYTKLQGE